MKPLLGGKGANLAEMCRIGLPVPPGFTITTEVCTYYYANKRTYPVRAQARRCRPASPRSRSRRARSSATSTNPLLVSVRSGARDSMPGMMDTILNLGLNDETVEALAKKTGNPRFAWDCYRRFVQMYGDVVLGVQKRAGRGPRAVRDRHRRAQARALRQRDIEDTKLTTDDLKELVARFKALVKERTGQDFPAIAVGPARWAPSAPCSARG